MVSIETFRMEQVWHPADGNVTEERVQTGGWGVTIKSSKDLVQIDDEPVQTRNAFSDKTREKMR